MEFPNLGQHCNEKSCNKLDFLPMKCDGCGKEYCCDHFHYERHNCKTGIRKDFQVPLCPLCNEPVPTAPGVEPDVTVSQHIDQQCKSETKKIFTNRCSFKNCKRKELIPVFCSQCKRNFCLRHRHTADHVCDSQNTVNQQRNCANAAELRRTQKPPSNLFNANFKPNAHPVRTTATDHLTNGSVGVQNIQGNMSEDEALARAIALSILELDESNNRDHRNAVDAAQTQRPNNNTSVPVGGRDNQPTNSKDKCSLS
uniref:AN1-type domain-containing protein n=1 Tax=Glossina palpalis gambiensis TaxID=67801 RepID=A0A1B0C3H8_9MUSC